MYMKRVACIVLSCVIVLGTMLVPANAIEIEDTITLDSIEFSIGDQRATESFNTKIPANRKARANSSFPLVAGETITIKASYAPFNASVDFGVIAPDGKFYYVNVTGGSIDKTILVDQNGDYTFQMRNNSNSEVKVSGFVNY